MSRAENLLKEFEKKSSTITPDAVTEALWYLEKAQDQKIPSHCPAYENGACKQVRYGNPNCPDCSSRKADIVKLRLLIGCMYPDTTNQKEEENLGNARFKDGSMGINGIRSKITTPVGDVYVAHAYVPSQDKVNCTIIVDSRFDDTLSLSGRPLTEDQINREQWHKIAKMQRQNKPVDSRTIVPNVPLPPHRTSEVLKDLKDTKIGSGSDNPYRGAKHKLLRKTLRRK